MKTIQYFAIIIALCAICAPAFAFTGEDTATSYTTSWEGENGGAGFGPWSILSDAGHNTSVEPANQYGGNSSVMDTTNKCFIFSVFGSTVASFGSISRSITAPKSDGMTFTVRLQMPEDHFFTMLLAREGGGQFGEIRPTPMGWEIIQDGEFIQVDIPKDAPVEATFTLYGTTSKWDLTLRDLQTQVVKTYTNLNSFDGAGHMSEIIILLTNETTETAHLLFNQLKIESQGPSKVDNALEY